MIDNTRVQKNNKRPEVVLSLNVLLLKGEEVKEFMLRLVVRREIGMTLRC